MRLKLGVLNVAAVLPQGKNVPMDEAQTGLIDELLEGKATSCPCCGQTAKIYPRKLTKPMVLALAWIAKNPYVKTSEFPNWMYRTRQYNVLHHWGLLQRTSLPDDGFYWVITDKGARFLRGEISVPLRAIVFNNETIGYSAEEVFRHQVVEDFDLGDLLDPAHIKEAV